MFIMLTLTGNSCISFSMATLRIQFAITQRSNSDVYCFKCVLHSGAYWVTPYPLTVGCWIPYPLMLGGWDQPFICTFLPKTGLQDIFLISYDAKRAYFAKRSSLRCYSMVHTQSLMSQWSRTLTKIPLTFGFVRGWVQQLNTPLTALWGKVAINNMWTSH